MTRRNSLVGGRYRRAGSDDDKALDAGYAAAIALWTNEGTLIWAKTTAFIYGHTILILAFATCATISYSEYLRILLYSFPLAGLILCAIWDSINTRSFLIHDYWIKIAKRLERRRLSPAASVSIPGLIAYPEASQCWTIVRPIFRLIGKRLGNEDNTPGNEKKLYVLNQRTKVLFLIWLVGFLHITLLCYAVLAVSFAVPKTSKPEIVAEPLALYQQKCAACHGTIDGQPRAGYPILAGQHKSYLVSTLAQYRSGHRKNEIMTPIAKSLSSEETDSTAELLAKQTSPLQMKY